MTVGSAVIVWPASLTFTDRGAPLLSTGFLIQTPVSCKLGCDGPIPALAQAPESALQREQSRVDAAPPGGRIAVASLAPKRHRRERGCQSFQFRHLREGKVTLEGLIRARASYEPRQLWSQRRAAGRPGA